MLKGFFSKYKGAAVTYKLSSLIDELKCAWQRAWRGYDYTDVINLDLNFIERMILLLKEFRKHNFTLFQEGDRTLSEEETNQVIDEMIYCFENSDSDVFMDLLYGRFDEKTCVFESTPTDEQRTECYDKAQKNKERALELFVKYFDCLWY